MQRPEEPSEWAGLPSEPHENGSPAERPADGPQAADWSPDLLGDAPSTAAWIEIPVETAGTGDGSDGAEAD